MVVDDISQLIICHGFDKATTEIVLERMNSDLARMKFVWFDSGKDTPGWVYTQIEELELAIDWLQRFYYKNWPSCDSQERKNG